jgi:radical SAM superfamily enzyme YgiQ (UPF0313 family)
VLFVHLDERLFATARAHPRHQVAPVAMAHAMGCATRDGHDVEFIETATGEVGEAELRRRLEGDRAELVVIQPTQEALPFVRDVVAMARPRERTVLLAGAPSAHASASLLARTGARAVALGEWDEAPGEVAVRLAAGGGLRGVPGLLLAAGDDVVRTAPRPIERDLDRLPPARHDLLLRYRYQFHYPLRPRGRLRMGYVLASRGCPYACVYCSEVERASVGKPYRTRSAARVVDELRGLAGLGATGVYFADDLFALDRARLLGLCGAIERARLGLSWSAQLRAGDIDDEAAEALARAGCASVACGIESGSDRVLEFLKKDAKVAGMRRGAAALRRAGVELVAFLIVGVPIERAEEREATLRLASELGASLVQLHIFASYPGTYAAQKFPELGTGGATKFAPTHSRADRDELLAVRRRFYLDFYLRPDRLVRHVVRRVPQVLSNPRGELGMAWRLARLALFGG